MMEDYNVPSVAREALLQTLQNAVGDVPLHFWAACQLCDLKSLEGLTELASLNPAAARLIAGQTQTMLSYCKKSISTFFIRY